MLHTQLQIIFGKRAVKNKKNKTKTPNPRRPVTALVMQSQPEGSTSAKDLTPKRDFLTVGCSHISAATEAWRPDLYALPEWWWHGCSEGLFSAGPVLAWLPKSFLMNPDQQNPTFQDQSRQKLLKTLPLYFFLLFLEVSFPAPRPLRQRKYQPNMQVWLLALDICYKIGG